MQTFLPFATYESCAEVIDPTRLNKQILEVCQLLDSTHQVAKADGGWAPPATWAHPARLMWAGYEPQLIMYGEAMLAEHLRRGGNSSGAYERKFEQHMSWATSGEFTMERPAWTNDPQVHRMYQSILLKKRPEWYGPFFPGVPDDIEMVYPI